MILRISPWCFVCFLLLTVLLVACTPNENATDQANENAAPQTSASPTVQTNGSTAEQTNENTNENTTEQAPEEPSQSPWRLGTPTPLFAPLSNECLASNDSAAPLQLQRTRYGTNVFLFATDRERVLALTRIAGFEWIRQQIHWRDLEGERGQFVWTPLDQIVTAARANNLQIMLSIVRSPPWATATGHDGLPDDPAMLAEFLREVATRYRGRVAAYQIWNEPNLDHEGGGTPADPAHYLDVLQAGYQAIKETDPCALVISAAMASTINPDPAIATEDLAFFEALYSAEDGAFLQAADIVALHPGAGSNPPGERWPADALDTSHQYFRHIERVRELMLRYNDPRQVWITEYGWTTTTAEGAPLPVTEEQQASYVVDALWDVRQRYPWISGVFHWNLNFSIIAPPEDEKTTYSVLTPEWGVRPAFIALQNNVPALRDSDRPPFVPENAGLQHSWTFPGRGNIDVPPLVAPDGTLYVVSEPGTLYAIDRTGQMQWRFYAPGSISAAPARTPEGMLFVNDSGSILTAINPDGTQHWQQQMSSLKRGSPVYLPAQEYVVVTSVLGEVTALDLTGTEVWTYEMEDAITPAIATSDGALVVINATGQVSKLNATGELLWQQRHVDEFWTPPLADQDGGLYAITVAGRVLALDAAGQARWSTSLGAPVLAEPFLSGDGATLFVAARNGVLSALDTASGNIRWQFSTNSDLVAPPRQAAAGMLYLGTVDERLLAINADGTLRWQLQLRDPVHAPPALGNAAELYISTTGGRLYAFEAVGR